MIGVGGVMFVYLGFLFFEEFVKEKSSLVKLSNETCFYMRLQDFS